MLPATTAPIGDPSAPPPPAPDTARLARRMTWGVAGLAAAGCVYLAIADPNTSTVLPPCPFKTMTGLDCPGCGITRSLHALLQGNVMRAFDHNVFFVVALVIGIIWFARRRIQSALGREVKPFRLGTGAAIALGLVVAGFWFVRNIPWAPLHWLQSGAAGV